MMPMGPMQGMPPMGGMNLGGMAVGLNHETIDREIMMIPPMSLSALKHELGFGDKDLLNMGDKVGF